MTETVSLQEMLGDIRSVSLPQPVPSAKEVIPQFIRWTDKMAYDYALLLIQQRNDIQPFLTEYRLDATIFKQDILADPGFVRAVEAFKEQILNTQLSTQQVAKLMMGECLNIAYKMVRSDSTTQENKLKALDYISRIAGMGAKTSIDTSNEKGERVRIEINV